MIQHEILKGIIDRIDKEGHVIIVKGHEDYRILIELFHRVDAEIINLKKQISK